MIEIKCTGTELLPLKDIKEFQGSLKKRSKRDIEKLKASIERYGFSFPFFVWVDDGVNWCLDGHGRIQTLTEMGALGQSFPVVYVEADSEEEAKKKLLQMNSQYGQITLSGITDFLDGIEMNFDDIALPAGNLDLRSLIKYDDEEADPNIAEKDELLEKYGVRRGDVWILGRHRLMCGDATSESDVATLMNGVSADMIFTDPPYNVDYEGKTKDALKIQNDKFESNSAFYEFLLDSFMNMYTSSKTGAPIYVCHADSEGLTFRQAFKDSGYELKQCIIWNKNTLVMGRQDYHWKHEPILYGWKLGSAHTWYGGRKQSTVWDVDKPQRSNLHPTTKPVDLIIRAVSNSSKGGDVVLDLFGGSGSTLIGCEISDRACYTMELDESYCAVVIDRWERQTGSIAEKESIND